MILTSLRKLLKGIARQLNLLREKSSVRAISVARSWRLRRWQRWMITSLLSMSLLIGMNVPVQMTIAEPIMSIQLPLSTSSSEIVDAAGQTVLLRGVNWFGMETDLRAPHGLWQRDYKDLLAQIKSLGYNVVRVPFAVQTFRETTISGVDFSIGSNRDLQDKTPLEVLDLIVQEAGRQGLMILLDSHRLNLERIPELWYGDGFTEEDWITTWTMLAERYRNLSHVIGADLKNEPHGRASWGTNDRDTDWRLAAERAGNAILAVNPDWLIVVEGVEKNVPGQRLTQHWHGGNLEGVRNYPVRISNPRKLVYSPHEYGPGVYDHIWFSEPTFPRNLLDRWEIGFYYIARQQIAPVWIGEFGGRQVDSQSKEGVWQRQLVDFIDETRLGFAYWSWNPNSRDTGGILTDDWQTIDEPKQQLLSKLLPVPIVAATAPDSASRLSPRPAPSESTPRSTPRTASNTLRTEFTLQSDWEAGFCASFRVTNSTSDRVRDWRLRFEMNQADINQSWNGNFIRQGLAYTVIPAEWAQTLQPDQTVDMGFCAGKRGSDYLPRQINASSRSRSEM